MSRQTTNCLLAATMIVLALVGAGAAWASPPATISYQGMLTDPLAGPVNGSSSMTFSIYDASTAGRRLWSESWLDVAVSEGRFSVLLGSMTPLDPTLFDLASTWLEVAVDGQVLLPRRPFSSVPYALRCAVADSVAGGTGGGGGGEDDGDWTLSGTDVYRSSGHVGIGTSSPAEALDVRGTVALDVLELPAGSGSPILSLSRNDGTQKGFVFHIGGSGYGAYPLQLGRSDGSNDVVVPGRLGIGVSNPAAALDVAGLGRVSELEITGGADLAEPFDIEFDEAEEERAIQPGTLLSIDPMSPGALRITTRAYDTAVAGVVSGANGIRPGLVMAQRGTPADGRYPVALTGRVYCLADASSGPIHPGDLLTSSCRKGHAMKATDPTRSRGAILGKAMSSLEEGVGHVYVLVSLQ